MDLRHSAGRNAQRYRYGATAVRARWIGLMISAVALVACTGNVVVPPEPAESGILRGTVTLEGEPHGGATIRITDPVGAGLSTTGTSDANGQYAKEIVAGRWNVSVLLNSEAVVDCPTYSNVTVSENRESVRDFACTLVRGTLRGIVTRDGAPVPGQPVQIVNQSNADVTTVVTNGEGEYSAQLLPGSYAAFTMIVGAQCVAEPLVADVIASQTASSPIGCTTIPGTLTGTVTVDGQPVPAGFPVTIYGEDSQGALVVLRELTTDAAGRYSAELLPGVVYPSAGLRAMLCPDTRELESTVMPGQETVTNIPCLAIAGLYDSQLTETSNTCNTPLQPAFGVVLKVTPRISANDEVTLEIDVGDRPENTRVTGPLNAETNTVAAQSPPFQDQGITILETWSFTVRAEEGRLTFRGLINVNLSFGAASCEKQVNLVATKTGG